MFCQSTLWNTKNTNGQVALHCKIKHFLYDLLVYCVSVEWSEVPVWNQHQWTAGNIVGSQAGFRHNQAKRMMEILTKLFITQNTKFNLRYDKMSFQSFIVHVIVTHKGCAWSTQTNCWLVCVHLLQALWGLQVTGCLTGLWLGCQHVGQSSQQRLSTFAGFCFHGTCC